MWSLFTLPLFLLAVFCVAFSQAFVQYKVLQGTWPQWQGQQQCQNQGYDGLAIIDDAGKWQAVLLQLSLESLPSGEEVWIGLSYNTLKGKPEWSGGQIYSWGAWGPGQPNWLSTGVLLSPNGTSYMWSTKGINYEHRVLCGKHSERLRMVRYPNRNVNLSGVTALATETKSVAEDCGVLCGTLTSCVYFTYDAASSACNLYNQTAAATLAVDAGSPSSFLVYQMAAQ